MTAGTRCKGRPGSATRSGWSRRAQAGACRRRGVAPGREKYRSPSTTTIATGSSRPSVRRRASSASNPHAATTTSSGSRARAASHVVRCDRSPGRPRTSSPPASATISGTQCPALNGGSTHSATKTRRRDAAAVAAPVLGERLPHPLGQLHPTVRDVEPCREHLDRPGDALERHRVERDDLGR